MFNLIQLFVRLSGFFVFLLLEIICFSLVVKYNQKQGEVYASSVNRLTGWLRAKSSAANAYFSLEEKNEILNKENAVLRELAANMKVDTSRLQDTAYVDSLVPFPLYVFTEANILNNSTNRQHNYFTLDKGAKDGIAAHSGVVSGDGVVGIVRKVSANYSVAMSILHRQMRLSARVRHKNYFGSLVWKSSDHQLFNLEEIPKHATVTTGDTVETSGYSAMFPPGLLLGTVEKMWMEPGSNYYTIEVRSQVNMSRIQHASIVRNIFKQERQALEQAVLKEDDE